MVTEDERKAPPGGGRDGAIEGQSPGSEDGGKNKPNGSNSQDGFDFAAFENLGSNGGAAPISRVVAFWVYTDEHGAPLYKVERLEDGTLGANGKPKKTFRQSKADGRGGWVSGMDGVRRAFAAIDEDDGAVWLRRHLDYCTAPLLAEPWILDIDTTVKLRLSCHSF